MSQHDETPAFLLGNGRGSKAPLGGIEHNNSNAQSHPAQSLETVRLHVSAERKARELGLIGGGA